MAYSFFAELYWPVFLFRVGSCRPTVRSFFDPFTATSPICCSRRIERCCSRGWIWHWYVFTMAMAFHGDSSTTGPGLSDY